MELREFTDKKVAPREIVRRSEMLPGEAGKLCAKCKEMRPLAAFSPDKRKADGLHSYCGECQREYQREKRRSLSYEIPEAYVDPSAPTLYEKGRKCHKCGAKVNRYSSNMRRSGKPKCYRCREKDIDREVEKAIRDAERNRRFIVRRDAPCYLTNLKSLRLKKGLPKTKLARMAGCSVDSIHRYEKRTMRASHEAVIGICEALGCSKDALTS